jgi:ElaA protein
MTCQWQTAAFDQLTPQQLYTALQLRQQVFVIEQDCLYPDLDNKDQQAIHMLCWEDGKLLAYQRCLAPGASYPESSIGRVVVAAEGRGRQLGRTLVERGIAHNLQQWPHSGIRIGAQAYLQRFYTELGFAVQGDIYLEDGIDHIQMLYLDSSQL